MASDEDAPDVRKGQGNVELSREEFRRRLGERFYDPAFDAVRPEIERVIEVAWDGYLKYRKSPRKRKAGPGFADPEFELPIEWLDTRDRILAAERRQKDPSTSVLKLMMDRLVCADGGNPGRPVPRSARRSPRPGCPPGKSTR